MRLQFLQDCLRDLDDQLRDAGSGLIVVLGKASERLPALVQELGCDELHFNAEYETQLCERDGLVSQLVAEAGKGVYAHRDHVIFDKDSITTSLGRVCDDLQQYLYLWRKRLRPEHYQPFDCSKLHKALAPRHRLPESPAWRSPGDWGLIPADMSIRGGVAEARRRLLDFMGRLHEPKNGEVSPPGDPATELWADLRFGTLSVRHVLWTLITDDSDPARSWIPMLARRDFFTSLLYNFPRTETEPLRSEFRKWVWENDPQKLIAWCSGQTGYPIVDAAIRQLRKTGLLHHQLRHLAASFLTKDLFIDWKIGERFFARHLIDFDLALNVGEWQWAADMGADNGSYFRSFNPVNQSKKYDPTGEYIRLYVPELRGLDAEWIHEPWRSPIEVQQAGRCVIGADYPAPIVDHADCRIRAMTRFESTLGLRAPRHASAAAGRQRRV